MKKKEPKWIEFYDITDDLPGGKKMKTRVFHIHNKETRTFLGYIKWYGGFRKYSFFPEPNMVFEATCLQDIIDFIQELMDARKKEKIIHVTYDPNEAAKSIGGRLPAPERWATILPDYKCEVNVFIGWMDDHTDKINGGYHAESYQLCGNPTISTGRGGMKMFLEHGAPITKLTINGKDCTDRIAEFIHFILVNDKKFEV